MTLDPRQKLAVVNAVEPFRLLSDAIRERLAKEMTVVAFRFGDVVFSAGDDGDAMYVIVSGKARAIGADAAGQEVSLGVHRAGDHFGVGALITGVPRSATMRAADDLIVLRLDRTAFDKIISSDTATREALRRYIEETGIHGFLKQYTIFENTSPHFLRTLINDFEEVRAKTGDVIIREGSVGDRFYIVRKGILEASKTENGVTRIVGEMAEGEYFGELALMTGAPRAATVIARSDVELYAMSKAGFDRVLSASGALRERFEERAQLYRADLAAAGEEARATTDYESVESDAEPVASTIRPSGLRRFFRNFPVIFQHDETDCGAASLAMICEWYGHPVGVARLRDLANVDSDGATMWSVAQAAESLGFHARGLHLSYEALRDITLPAIMHWEGVHYIVLYEVGRRGVVVADPGIGLRKLSEEEFCKGWTGRALELVPTGRLERTEKIRTSFQRFLPIFRPHFPLIFEIMIASLVLNLLGLGPPIFTQIILDRVVVTRSMDLLNMLLAGMFLVSLFQASMKALRQMLVVHVSTRADAHLIGDFLRHVFILPQRFFDLRRVGDIISRVSENSRIRQALIGTIPGVILDAVMAITYIGVMAFYSVQLTLVVLAVMPFFVMLILAFTPAIRRNRKEIFAKGADASSYLIESITGLSTVKAMAVEKNVRWKLETLFVESLLLERKGAKIEMAYSTAAYLMQSAGSMLFLWYGAIQVMEGKMSVGQLMAFTTFAASIMNPILGLVDAWDELQDVRNSIERLNDVFDARPEEETDRTLLNLANLEGRIRFEKVSFKYIKSQDKPTLSGITFELRPGETIALVGRSGSGKTTIAKLILGLYHVNSGKVYIDGHDIRTLSKQNLRRKIGVVPQDVYLFSGTIRENIALGDPNLPFDRVVTAAKQAGAHDFISELGLGYDSKVGERGMSLSGGQRQRIALARALVHSPTVLLLDEATSALDNESERAIQRSLESAAKGRTTLVIAHRLSTVKNADRILVLDAGAIVEEGKHEELMRRGGLYSSLVGQQVRES